MNFLKRKPKPLKLRTCPRYKAGWYCHMDNNVPCPDCGRGIQA